MSDQLETRIRELERQISALSERVKGLESAAEERLRKLLSIESKTDKILWVGLGILGSLVAIFVQAWIER